MASIRSKNTKPEVIVRKFLQHNVGCTGQSLHINAEAEAMCEKKFPHNNLRLRILASDACHAPMPLFGCHSVCHGRMLLRR